MMQLVGRRSVSRLLFVPDAFFFLRPFPRSRRDIKTVERVMNEVTRILSAIEEGDAHAPEQLLPLVYDELRKLAAQKLAQEKPGQTLEATALVHEAYLRLVDVEKAQQWT